MPFVIKLLIFFLFCVTFKALYNYTKYLKTIKIKKKYEEWIKDCDSVPDMETYHHDILTLFKQAKVKDAHIPVVQNVGYGKIASTTCSVSDNMFVGRRDIAASVLVLFDAAIGYYRSSYRSAFSPLYWIETIVFLPKNLIEYTGADLEKSAVKIVNLILTGMWWLICLFCACFKPEVVQLIQTLLQKLAQP